ncbi:hypothetical protein R3P38DRAFT_3183868 [Favolaschia claudopus]|uniref:Secreted protein n=1 Tax=Favolaschia claudopus TaxID=2862362 RepID=A0AAW0CBQ9_9AGAR
MQRHVFARANVLNTLTRAHLIVLVTTLHATDTRSRAEMHSSQLFVPSVLHFSRKQAADTCRPQPHTRRSVGTDISFHFSQLYHPNTHDLVGAHAFITDEEHLIPAPAVNARSQQYLRVDDILCWGQVPTERSRKAVANTTHARCALSCAAHFFLFL